MKIFPRSTGALSGGKIQRPEEAVQSGLGLDRQYSKAIRREYVAIAAAVRVRPQLPPRALRTHR